MEALRCLFPVSDDDLEEREFSKLHRIVLGIASLDLSAELATYYTEIDYVDSEGFTPLIWAARRGDNIAVDLLLKAGANPNIHTSLGDTALEFAARSSLVCVRMLLEAGANPTKENYGSTNALHSAANYQDCKEMVECLVAAGVDLHNRNIWGAMPLAAAASRNHTLSVTSLLDCGAHIDSRDYDGDTALHESVRWHADDIMQLLLNRGADYTLLFSTGGSILHVAALSGSLRTLEILQAVCLRDIDPDLVDRQGKTPLQIAQERVTKEAGFLQKFQTLLYDIRTRNASNARSPEPTSGTASEDVFSDAAEDPSLAPVSSLHNTASSGFSRWTRPGLKSTTRSIRPTWTAGWYTELRTRFVQSKLTVGMIYWLLGLGWAGFIYMILLPKRIGSGEQDGGSGLGIGEKGGAGGK